MLVDNDPDFHGTIAQPNEPLIVRYDPRDLSHLLVIGNDLHYHRVPYANVTGPPISLAELRHLQVYLRAQSKAHIDENLLFATHDKQQNIIAAAVTTTKPTRRRVEAARRGKTETLAFQDAKARIHQVQTARWVEFSRAQMAVDELEWGITTRPVPECRACCSTATATWAKP